MTPLPSQTHTKPSPSSSSAAASSTPYTASAKRSQQTTIPETLNPTKHYTGDFFVETVSLLNAQDRGSFVSESSGNKLPISWFATSLQNGKRQMKNGIATAKGSGGAGKLPSHVDAHVDADDASFSRKEYSSSSSSASASEEEMESPGADAASASGTLDDQVEYIGHIPTNIFFKDFAKVRNASKLKREHQHQQQHNSNMNSNSNNYQSNSSTNNRRYYDNDLSSSSSSPNYKRSLLSVVSGGRGETAADVTSPNDATTSATATQYQHTTASLSSSAKQRRATLADENIETCPDNKWQGTVRSHTNAAGSISSETSGLWWLNELCEQDDIIEFR